MTQDALHVDPTPDIFLRILLLRHYKANLEMMWPSHTLKPSQFFYCLADFTLNSCSLYVATYVEVKCIGVIIGRLMADTRKGVRERSPQKIFVSHAFQTVGKPRKHLLSIYASLILA